MARVAGPASLALAGGAAAVWASQAFTAAKLPATRTETLSQVQPANPNPNPSASTSVFSAGATLAVPAVATALAAGLGRRHSRAHARVAAEAVLTKDSAGRFRFAVEGGGGGSPAPEPSSGGQFDPAQQVGVTDPLGFFDPLGFSKVGDEEGFRKLREAELKHARVAMMASAGLLVQSVATFSIFEGTPKGIYAAITPPGAIGFALLFVASGVLELFVWKQDPSKDVGDFGDPAGWGIFNKDPDPVRRAEWVLGFKQRELNNGRFAMFATIGIILAEIVSGKTAWAQFGLTFEG